MREIEKEIIREIEFGHDNLIEKSFSCRDRLKKTGYNSFEYYLWNSNVFTKNVNSVEFSFCGYSTAITKNRINIFLWKYLRAGISQKNYKLYLHYNGEDREIDSCSRYSIDLNTGFLQRL